jgi:hypothetical protein
VVQIDSKWIKLIQNRSSFTLKYGRAINVLGHGKVINMFGHERAINIFGYWKTINILGYGTFYLGATWTLGNLGNLYT